MYQNPEQLDVESLQSGIARDENGACTCVVCGSRFTPGEVYPMEGRFFEAEHAARRHVQLQHGGMLQQLLCTESRYVALTDHQKKLMRLFAAGCTDSEVAAETGATAATVRRQRFMFREKAKQAKMYLALYGLAIEKRQAGGGFMPLPEGVPIFDDRFLITQRENDRILENAFSSLQPLRLKVLPAKEKKKVAVLTRIATQFSAGRRYTEKEVNAVLKEIYPHDHVLLRRYLIEYGYMDRTADGASYWLRGGQSNPGTKPPGKEQR